MQNDHFKENAHAGSQTGRRPLHDRLSGASLNPSPSLYVRRLPAMLVAALGLVMSAFSFETGFLIPAMHTADSLVISSLTLSLLLSFIGGEDRWRTNPWLVIVGGWIVGPLSLCSGVWLLIAMQRFASWSVQGMMESLLSITLILFQWREAHAAAARMRRV